jgi:uncharacterized membrane protein
MPDFLMIPPWNGLHPLVVHFPVALLFVAPLFVLVGVLRADKGDFCRSCALGLMLLGVAGAFLAVETGEAAAEIAQGSAGFEAVMSEHHEMAENTRLLFSILGALYAAIVLVPRRLWTPVLKRWQPLAQWVFLVLYVAAMLVLVQTAHLGGHLVHGFGIRAPMGQ